MVENKSALLIGEAGPGKTATVEQWIYNRSWTDTPVSIIRFKIEKAGALPLGPSYREWKNSLLT